MHGRFAVVVAGAMLGCRTPTQISVTVRTDVACDADAPETSITIGPVGEIDDPRRAPVTVVRTTTCRDHRIGALVVVPSGGKEDELAIRVVTGIGTTAQACVDGGYAGACIVSRRALHFVSHESLDLPIDMDVRCEGVPCDTTKTCVDGACVSDTISDPGACHGEGCAGSTLLPPGGADAGVDTSDVADAGDAPSDTSDVLDAADAGPATQWALQLGPRDPSAQPSVAVDTDGSVVIATSFRGSTTLGGAKTSKGGDDVLFLKIGRDGVVQFGKQLGGLADDYGTAAALDGAGNIFVAGWTNGDMDYGDGKIEPDPGSADLFLAKYDRLGNLLFHRRMSGGNFEYGPFLAVDAGGNVFLGGNTAADSSFGGAVLPVSSNDVFLARYLPDLTYVDAKVYGGAGDDFATGLAATKDGSVVLVGASNGTIDFGDGAHAAAGGADDAFVAKIDSSLATRWSRYYGDTFTQAAGAVAVDDGNRVVVGGFLDGTVDFGGGAKSGPALFVLRLDAAGAHNLSKSFASSYNTQIDAVAVDAAGNIALGGYFEGSLSFGGTSFVAPGSSLGDAFFAELDVAGAHVHSTALGDAAHKQLVSGFAIDRSAGAFVLAGGFGGSMSFPFRTVTTTAFETWVARLIP